MYYHSTLSSWKTSTAYVMPLVIQMLIADADAGLAETCKAATGHYALAMESNLHLLSAQGVFDELGKQLNDPNSRLRNGTGAFGILAALGTSLRMLESRVVRQSDLPDQISLDPSKDPPNSNVFNESDNPGPLCEKVAMQSKVPTPVPTCGSTKINGPVPPISTFPLGSWYGFPSMWLSRCTPETCKTSCSKSRVKAVVICESRCSPELNQTCEPARIFGVSNSDLAAVYEAGSGGWPMCLPQAYAAFRLATVHETEGDMVSKQAFLKNDMQGIKFHHVALEADDDEVTLLLSNSKITSIADLPPWLTSTRVVVPRSGILLARLWSAHDVASSWPTDRNGGHLFHNWVELECTPRNSPSPVSLLIALPSADLARRFHQVFSTTPRPPMPPRTPEEGEREALVCELQLLAKIDLEKEGQDVNCGTSIRRSITEALGIQRNRVQVLSVTNGGGTILGWAAAHISQFQKSLQPSELKSVTPFVPE